MYYQGQGLLNFDPTPLYLNGHRSIQFTYKGVLLMEF